jgi:hypothetical protein
MNNDAIGGGGAAAAGGPSNEARLIAGGDPDGKVPNHSCHIWPWLKGPAQRFILPNWAAITIGRHIFSWQQLDEFSLAHELCHVRQWSQHGIMYIPHYFAASRAAKAAGKDQYRGNAFEAEAYSIEDDLRAVRAGGRPA